MFRRSWDSLPADPTFESDLKTLGYFINEDDEVRNIEKPRSYFKYFINKNERWNERQRFALHEALGKIYITRYAAHGISQVHLPLDAPPSSPRVPVLATDNLSSRSRVVVLFGESFQDLGVFAYRIASGPGGLNAGSAVSLAEKLGVKNTAAPGLVVANPGQLYWCPNGRRVLNPQSQLGVQMPSAAHRGYVTTDENRVSRNNNVDEHVACVFEDVLTPFLTGKVGKEDDTKRPLVDVIAVGDSADAVEAYLDQEKHWRIWGPVLSSLTIMGGMFDGIECRVAGFRQFLRERARAYIVSEEPLDMPIAGSNGNTRVARFTAFGCPVYSSGEAQHTEMIPIRALDSALAWINEVARGGPEYSNPDIIVSYDDGSFEGAGIEGWGEDTVEEGVDLPSEGNGVEAKVVEVAEELEKLQVNGEKAASGVNGPA